jgi:type I pantothenate kinase
MTAAMAGLELSPYVAIDRSEWAQLGKTTQQPLTQRELDELRGLGDFVDQREVAEIYLPISQLLNIYATSAGQLHARTSAFIGERATRTPFVIGIGGSVAVGKSTAARLLKALISRWEGTPRVELVTTDGFLYPNAELERRGIMHRKGFPESYDRRALLKFVSDIKSGHGEVKAPVYSHLSYDIVPNEFVRVTTPDVLIIEGLNVLQPPQVGQALALSDFFDFTIYIDADTTTIGEWYLSRFEQLWDSAFTDPASYFHQLTTELSREQAIDRAREFWRTINLPNLIQNILPTRSRSTLVLRKSLEHRIESVLLRKI